MSIEAMKQALEALEMGLGQVDGDYDTAIQKAIGAVTALRTAIEQAEKQEPVAWMCHPFGDTEVEFSPHQECENCTPLYTTPPAAPNVATPLAAQRQSARSAWVGLTDEEIFETHKQVDSMQYLTFGKAIEAKLREKNGGQA